MESKESESDSNTNNNELETNNISKSQNPPDNLSSCINIDPKKKEKKSGVLYIQTIPPNFTVSKMRAVLSQYSEIGRIYFQAEKTRSNGKKRKRYTEGWVEFKSKSAAKRIASYLNGTPVGGKRRSLAYDSLWAVKYLRGFKWAHLMEQLTYEKRVEQKRMRSEISQAKKRANFFSEQVEKGEKIRKLEERTLKKGGLWESYQRQTEQRKIISESKMQKNKKISQSEDFLHMIFDKQ